MSNKGIEFAIKKIYKNFFINNNIDPKSGILSKDKTIRLSNYPYIGEKYGEKQKILFVGLDMGKDAYKTMDFKQKRKDYIIDIKTQKDKWNNAIYNNHLMTTALVAIYFLSKKIWNKIDNHTKPKQAVKYLVELGVKNPFLFISLTNYHKWVSIGKRDMSAGNNRRYHLGKEIEEKLLFDEIKVLNPDIIIFQSIKDFDKATLICKVTKISDAKIYLGPHPSYRGTKIPREYMKKLIKL